VEDSQRDFYSTSYTARLIQCGLQNTFDVSGFSEEAYRFDVQQAVQIPVVLSAHLTEGSLVVALYKQ